MCLTVTGGAGYIGSVVAEVLLRDDLDVHVIDNLVKGRPRRRHRRGPV